MGFYFRLAPGIRLGVTQRGLRASLGPRSARLHVGAGRPGLSTGAGPLTYYQPLSGSSGSSGAAGKAKLLQAQQVNAVWDRLLNVQHDAFGPAKPKVIAPPVPPSLREYTRDQIKIALRGTPWWRLLARHHRKTEVRRQAAADYSGVVDRIAQDYQQAQDCEQQRWNLLLANDPLVTMQQLDEAFADNDMPSTPIGIEGTEASIAVLAPAASSLPERIGGVTDAGNVSLRRVPKGQRESLATSITCGYAVVTAREAFAVAPALMSVRIVVLRQPETPAANGAQLTCVLAVRWERSSLEGETWLQHADEHDANAVALTAATATEMLMNVKRQQLEPLDLDNEPDLQRLVAAVDQEWLEEETT